MVTKLQQLINPVGYILLVRDIHGWLIITHMNDKDVGVDGRMFTFKLCSVVNIYCDNTT